MREAIALLLTLLVLFALGELLSTGGLRVTVNDHTYRFKIETGDR